MKDNAEEKPNFDLSLRDSLAEGVYWTQQAFVRGHSADRVATELAQRFLPMIERAIADRGYRLVTAIEVECDLHAPTPDLLQSEHAHIKQALADYSEKIQQKPTHWFNHAPLVGMDVSSYPIRSAYICGANMELTTPPATPMQTASHATSIKRAMARVNAHQEGAHPTRFDADLAEILGDMKAGFDTKYVNHVSDDIGEHLNLSLYLHNGQPHQRIDEDNLSAGRHWPEMLKSAIKEYMFSDALLLDSGEQSYRRLDTSPMVRSKVADRNRKDASIQEMGRLEVRLPGAACNSWLNVLVSSAAVAKLCMAVQQVCPEASSAGFTYGQMAKIDRAMREGTLSKPLNAIDSPEEVITRFEQYGQTIGLLHRIVDEQVTDSQENAKYHADVERFKAALIARSEQLLPQQSTNCAIR